MPQRLEDSPAPLVPSEPKSRASTDQPTTTSPPADPADVGARTRTLAGPPPAGDPANGPRLGRQPQVPGYEVLEELGHGGMGVIYRARHLALNREVALKMILAGAFARPADLDRFRAEAQAVARLQHPNIVQIFEVGMADGLPFFSLEFVSGGTLARKIAHEPQPPRFAAETVEQLARAMQYAHGQGIIHRDLKPANVLLDADQRPKITDFGLAKRLEGDTGQTQTGAVLGTPSYMAPEQAGGDVKHLGPAADIYSLGAVLYDLLTGRPPFAGGSVLDTLEMVRTRDAVPPSQLVGKLPRDLETITLKCLQKDPARRYASAADLADDLRRFLDGRPILARPVGTAERAWRWARRNPWVAGLGSTVAVLLVAVAAVTTVLSLQLNQKRQEAERLLQQAQDAEANEAAERKKAEAARDQEAQARRLTAEQRRLALDTVRDILLRVDELMKNDARLAPLRLEIIRRMLTDVDNIRDHARKNPLEDRTEALAFSRIGEIYFRSNRVADATEWLTRAYRVLKALADESPHDPNALRNLATACHALARAEWRLGHGARSRQLHTEGLSLRQQRLKLLPDPDDSERMNADRELAESYELVAYDDLRLGEPDRAVANYLAADRILAALPLPGASMLHVRRVRNEIQVRLGDALSRLGRLEEAQAHYLKALGDRQDYLRTQPANSRNHAVLQTDLGQSHMYLGDFHLMVRKDAAAASPQYARCLDLFAGLLAKDPDNLDLRQRVAASHYRLGMANGLRPGVGALAGALGETAPALIHFDECLRIRRELGKIDPADMETQVELLLAYARLGQTGDVERTVDRILQHAGKDRQVLFQTACGLAILGAGKGESATRFRDRAFRVLDLLVELGWQDPGALKADPDLDSLRSDPRFALILARAAERPTDSEP